MLKSVKLDLTQVSHLYLVSIVNNKFIVGSPGSLVRILNDSSKWYLNIFVESCFLLWVRHESAYALGTVAAFRQDVGVAVGVVHFIRLSAGNLTD
jgi:hypothetical protein